MSRITATFVLLSIFSAHSFSDELTLRGGHQISGLLFPQTSATKTARLLTRFGTKQIPGGQIVARQVDGTEQQRYRRFVETVHSNDAANLFQLALWCRASGLKDECVQQLKAVLELNAEHQPALALMGELTATDPPGAQKPEMPEDANRGEREARKNDPRVRASIAAQQKQWLRELSKWIEDLRGKQAERRAAARERFGAIRDPMAVPALVQSLRSLDEDGRSMLLRTLAEIPGPEATSALGAVAVLDRSAHLRWFATEALRERDSRAYQPLLAQALQTRNRTTIFNAAEASAKLNNPHLVPHLIKALNTPTRYVSITNPYVALRNRTFRVDFTRH